MKIDKNTNKDNELKKDFEKNRDDYEKFFIEFGAAFKEGIYEDFERKKSHDKKISEQLAKLDQKYWQYDLDHFLGD